MKFRIQREAFLQQLMLVVGAIERKQSKPILANVLLRVEDGELSIVGTDLDVELISALPIEGDIEEGEITAPARKLIDITKALPEGAEIDVSIAGKKLGILCCGSLFSLNTLPSADFPSLEEGESKVSFSITQESLLFLMERVCFSIAQQDVRYYLNGLYFGKDKDKIQTVASDGHRLSMCFLESAGDDDSAAKVIIPRKAVSGLLRLLENKGDEVEVSVCENHIRVRGESYIFTSKLIDSEFPDYRHQLIGSADKEIVIDRDLFHQALTRMAILSNEKFHGVRFMFRPGRLVIQANNSENEESVEEIKLDYSGEALDIGVNAHYFLDAINVLPAGPLKVSFTDGNGRLLIKEAENDACAYIIMPLHI